MAKRAMPNGHYNYIPIVSYNHTECSALGIYEVRAASKCIT